MENSNFNKNKYVFTSLPAMLLVGKDIESNRSKQISLFLKELYSYQILLKDLVNFPIKLEERNLALNIVYYIAADENLNRMIMNKKDLPIAKLSKITKIKQHSLEKWRDYILAYYIILTNPEYKSIQDYFRIKLRESGDTSNDNNKNNRIYKGIALKVSKKSVYIVTSMGEFIKIKKEGLMIVGQLCEGKEKKSIKHWKIHISIIILILVFICSGILIQYNKTQSILVINTTSSIKLHINSFNRVIYAHSSTEKGKKLVESINIIDDDLDNAVTEIFRYALNNEMIPEDKRILITVSGKAVEYGTFVETNKFTAQNKIPIIINNSGNQQKLPEYLEEQDKENN